MKSIYTVITDIHHLIKTRGTGWFTDELAIDLGTSVASRLQKHWNDTRDNPSLRLSKMGPICPRHLWYSIYHPDLAEPLPSSAMIKYSYGHMLEAQAISLIKASGHEVTGEQDAVSVDGIVGHRDCIIDGCLCDVKSSSHRGFAKFEQGTLWENDDFGYLEQLDGYLCGSLEDPLLRVKDRAFIIAIDKELGHLALYEHRFREEHIRERIRKHKHIVSLSVPPQCECGTKSVGESGNIGLDTKASYSAFKHCCFPELRTFIYAKGKPVFLTKVVRLPGRDVYEVDKYGNRVYNQ